MGTVTQYNLANVQSALGGSNPISMSEYYRGGPYVPTTRNVTVREPSSGDSYARGSTDWAVINSSGTSLYWGGPFVASAFGAGTTSLVRDGYTYYRGGYRETTSEGNSYYGFFTLVHYAVYRTYGSTASINTGVPSSGAISISQLYGAANP
jgi:hypothetical protein